MSGLALVAALLSAACSGESHELVIEFFDWDPPAGVGGVEHGGEIVVDPSFDADPVYVIEEPDIQSWDDRLIRFSDEQTRLDLDELITVRRTLAPNGLLFRLSIDDDSYWGWVRSGESSAGYSPPYLTYDALEGFMYFTRGVVFVGDLDLEQAARQAWQD